MHILFATPEIAPFSQVGELGEYCAVLAEALQSYKPGHFPEDLPPGTTEPLMVPSPISSLSVITLLDGSMDPDALRLARRLTPVLVPWNDRTEEVVVFEGVTAGRVRTFFLAHELIGPTPADEASRATRYAFLSRAIVEFARTCPQPIDLIHCHGWRTALVPIYLDAYGRKGRLSEVLTMFSLHEIDEDGVFPMRLGKSLDLPRGYFTEDALEFDGKINFTQGGILFSDFVVSSSDTLNDELSDPDGGYALWEALADREEDLFGIMPGLDADDWDPSTDPHLSVAFDASHLNGKRRNKADVQHIFGLPARPMIPLLGFVGPLTEIKGVGLMIDAIEAMLKDGQHLQLVVMGRGDEALMGRLVKLSEAFPKVVGLHFEHDEALEHRILAGLDMILLPSQREASAHVHLRAMRYGTIPVVRGTGTLAQTVAEWSGQGKLPAGKGAGLVFGAFKADDLTRAIERAISAMSQPRLWRPMQEHCMAQDFSWASTAHRFVQLYLDLLEGDE